MTENQLNENLSKALKDKDATKVSVLRMLKADINNTAIKLKKPGLSEEDIVKVIKRHIKQHQDSIEQFRAGKREDLADKEARELVILKTYVPEEASDAELEAFVKASIEEVGAATPKDMGRIIKLTLEKAKGRADGTRVSALVQRFITK
jgi:uncharacterized protein